MTRCYVHIGLHKTGSTSIQRAFDDHRRALLERGINYLDLGRNHSGALYSLFSDAPERYDFNIRRGVDTPEKAGRHNALVAEQLDSLLCANRSPKLVLSGEDLSLLSADGVARLKRTLDALPGADVRIIVYVRDPIAATISFAQQFVRGGRQLAQAMQSLPIPQFRSRIGPYVEAFGRDRVDIRVFAPGEFVDGLLLADFLAAIGEDPASVFGATDLHLDESLSHEALLILDAINGVHPPIINGKANPARARPLDLALAAVPGARFVADLRLDDAQRADLQSHVDWLHGMLGREVFSIGETEPSTPRWTTPTLAAIGTLINAREIKISRMKRQVFIARIEEQVRKKPAVARDKVLRELIDRPVDPALHFALSRAYAALGQAPEAIAAARRAFELEPARERYRRWLARLEQPPKEKKVAKSGRKRHKRMLGVRIGKAGRRSARS